MKRDKIIQTIILVLTSFMGGWFLYGILQLPDRIEWFQLYGLLFYIIIFSSVYILILTIIGVVARLLKKRISRPIFIGTKWSILILTITIVGGVISGQRKVSETEKKMEKEWENNQKKDSIDYANRLDSLNKVILIDSTNYVAFVERGLMKRQNKQVEASIKDYKIALKLNPDDFNANFEMGYSLGFLGEKVQQDSFYKIAVRLDTNSYFAKKHPEYLK